MHLTIRQLKIFDSVCRHMNYTRAAEELHLTQPAVSMQVKQLEDQVGIPLFEQMGRKLYLTEAGKEIQHYSRRIIELLDEADAVIDDLRGARHGLLDISVVSTANYIITPLLAIFAKRFEGVTIRLDVSNRQTLLQQLEANEKDLVIMGQPPADLDLIATPFMENALVVIAHIDHPLAQKHKIPLSRLERETFVVREKGSGTRIAMERFFAERDIFLHTGMEMTSNEAIKQAVMAGLGLGIVSIHTLGLELHTGCLAVLDIEDFPIVRQWCVVHRQGKRLSAVCQAFKDFMINEAAILSSTLPVIPGRR
ncbi:MAG: LysR substrate-binding domain-containing protein [Pseudomonadota bacterium]